MCVANGAIGPITSVCTARIDYRLQLSATPPELRPQPHPPPLTPCLFLAANPPLTDSEDFVPDSTGRRRHWILLCSMPCQHLYSGSSIHRRKPCGGQRHNVHRLTSREGGDVSLSNDCLGGFSAGLDVPFRLCMVSAPNSVGKQILSSQERRLCF